MQHECHDDGRSTASRCVLIRVVVPTVKPVGVEEVPVDLASTTPSIERLLEEADAYLRAVAATPLFEGLR